MTGAKESALAAARLGVERAREDVRESGGDTWARVRYVAARERLDALTGGATP